MSDTSPDTGTREQRPCPDGGTCHHSCFEGPCFRVAACGPLSGAFPNNRWPEAVVQAERERTDEK